MSDRKYDLEKRLIEFGVTVIHTAEKFPDSFAGKHLSGQLIRSGSAPALHYGEAVSAESRNDFIHKMKIALKELRETNNCLQMISRLKWQEEQKINHILGECNELISIFVKSIGTAQKNKEK
ncbi:MAG: four helix bundle protein [Chitinophagaceae bacterium]|nr:four helix bundle protein [Chitinophagaceae bacterium]MCA6456001.1 four helix bundle protein [Chitinophagaceae bacterium]MCA6460478.1 four helix bundle protein [Chitinophagaceae bacterium]MCA6464176.1 four helix bundle protein [Chitinophagaceae bacterium]MEA3427543.1 four helix bundle protein [Bacteroidota bacterium]